MNTRLDKMIEKTIYLFSFLFIAIINSPIVRKLLGKNKVCS